SLGSPVTGSGPAFSANWDTTLVANGTHTVSATALDSSGNRTTTSVQVTVSNVIAPPVISAVTGLRTKSTTATITWTTDKNSDSQVGYGVSTAYGSTTPRDSAMVQSHSVVLTGLTPSSTYFFEVRSADAQGNTSTVGGQTLTTLAGTPLPPS